MKCTIQHLKSTEPLDVAIKVIVKVACKDTICFFFSSPFLHVGDRNVLLVCQNYVGDSQNPSESTVCMEVKTLG